MGAGGPGPWCINVGPGDQGHGARAGARGPGGPGPVISNSRFVVK